MFLVYNSDILSEDRFSISPNDRAFQYGDGLFETIRYEKNQVWFWPDHVARFTEGLRALHLTLPASLTADTLYQQILQLLSLNELTHQSARVKVQIWRQPGGLYTPTQNTANLLITSRSGQPFSITEKATMGIFSDFRLSPSPTSAFKTLNALPYVLAGLHKQQTGTDDVILLDSEGNVAECLASNLFWLANQTLYTPSLQTGCINGILRRQLLRLAPQVGLSVVEGCFKPDILSKADAVFCANVMGIQWLRSINDVPIQPTRSTEDLLALLFAQLHR